MSDTLYPIDEWENDGNAQWLGTEGLSTFPEWVGVLLTESIDLESVIRTDNEETSGIDTSVDKESVIRTDNEETSDTDTDEALESDFGSSIDLSSAIF